MVFAAAPEYRRLPHPRPLAEALRGGGARCRRDPAARTRRAARRRDLGHPHARAGARGRDGGRAVGDAHPPRRPSPAGWLPALLAGRAAPAHRRRAAGCGGADGRVATAACEQGRGELNGTRQLLGLPALERVHGGHQRAVVPGATFPQLDTRGAWSPRHERGRAAAVGAADRRRRAAAGRRTARAGRAVDVAGPLAPPSARDAGRARAEPVRVLATWNRRPPTRAARSPATRVLVEWVSYARTMPRCDVVVCHGGHGTVVRALASGAAVVAVPAAGDMNENAARIDWAGVGVRVPRMFCGPRPVRLAVGAGPRRARIAGACPRSGEVGSRERRRCARRRSRGVLRRFASGVSRDQRAAFTVPVVRTVATLPAASRATA